MPVKITLYAENIAVGTEVVNYALKAGAALGEYVETDPPIKSQNDVGRTQTGDMRRLHDIRFRGKGSQKQKAYALLQRVYGEGQFSLSEARDVLRSRNWSQSKSMQVVAALVKTGHIGK